MIFNLISSFLFIIGMFGLALNQKNFILILVSIELILLGANMQFLLYSVFFDDLKGQIFSLLILTLAACETAIGLIIIILFFKHHGNLNIEDVFNLRG